MSDLKKQLEVLATDPKSHADFLKRAENGDASTLPALRQLLAVATNVDKYGGNLASVTETTLIEAAAGKNLLLRESLYRKMKIVRAELAGTNPTPLETLLVERIALCWLTLHNEEARHAQSSGLSLRQADCWQRRIDSGHKRYLSAIRTLATVRKLAIPVLQVNIAERQTNVAVGTMMLDAKIAEIQS